MSVGREEAQQGAQVQGCARAINRERWYERLGKKETERSELERRGRGRWTERQADQRAGPSESRGVCLVLGRSNGVCPGRDSLRFIKRPHLRSRGAVKGKKQALSPLRCLQAAMGRARKRFRFPRSAGIPGLIALGHSQAVRTGPPTDSSHLKSGERGGRARKSRATANGAAKGSARSEQ